MSSEYVKPAQPRRVALLSSLLLVVLGVLFVAQLAALVVHRLDYPINDDTLTVSQIRGARLSPNGTRLVFAALDSLWIADLPQGRGGPAAEQRIGHLGSNMFDMVTIRCQRRQYCGVGDR